MKTITLDDFGKSPKSVTPAKAGVQNYLASPPSRGRCLDSRRRGNDKDRRNKTSSESVTFDGYLENSRISFPVVLFLLIILFSMSPPCWAATLPETLQSLEAKVESWEVENIWPEVLRALAEHPEQADLLATAANLACHRGDYPDALRLMQRSLAVGGEDELRRGFALFIEETAQALAPYKRYETPHFIIFLDEKQDGVLVDYLAAALEKTEQAMARLYGFRPREKVRVELFRDAGAFYRGSALSARDIEVAGAVGLAKFNKLQFLSPRALVHGYRWLDAISHEYMHYLIVKLTANKAPIWFHEGFAKYEEDKWRQGPGYLSPLYQALLAQALKDGKLIGFEKMEPSLLRLETPEEVQLAYAQSASAIEFIIQSRGQEVLKQVMARMAESRTPGAGEAIREVMGMDFTRFAEEWKGHLAAKAGVGTDLKSVPVNVRRYKVREGETEDGRMELKEIKSLVARNRAHLGDRLKERGRMRAAALEYRRALTELGDSLPIMNRLSAALIDLGQTEEALAILRRALELDPDHPTPYVQLGQIYLQRKVCRAAGQVFEGSLQINPFNPEVHAGLAAALAALGDEAGSARERKIANTLLGR